MGAAGAANPFPERSVMRKRWIAVALCLALGAAAGCMHDRGMRSDGMEHKSMSDGGMDQPMSDPPMQDGGGMKDTQGM
jgi:DNA mismatch repair protein MutH